MWRKLVSWSIAGAVLAVLLCPAVNHARPGTPQFMPAQAAGPRRGQERHPEIRRAIRALRNARQALQSGAHDFGGHRSKALEEVNQALKECNEALNYDKR